MLWEAICLRKHLLQQAYMTYFNDEEARAARQTYQHVRYLPSFFPVSKETLCVDPTSCNCLKESHRRNE